MFMLLECFLRFPNLGSLDSDQPEGKKRAEGRARLPATPSVHLVTLLSVGGMTLNPNSQNSREKLSTAKLTENRVSQKRSHPLFK